MFPREAPPRALSNFDILQRLGAGGVGEVFLARSRAGKLVAIKTIADARRDSHEGETADAFAREASVCVRLRHPCIVQVRAFLEDDGFAALVFEYIPGVALARVLRFCNANGVRLPDNAAWHVTERVLTALAYAHGFHDEAGLGTPIVHRDVSPSNVLLDWGGGVKIADFGIAKVLGVSPGTRVGIVKGTLGCMSPEQARGEPVDQRADVYAAALLAWRLATGRVPFSKHQKDEYELLRAMRNPRFAPLAVLRPDLPEPLLDAVARALEPEAARRTITAAEFADVVRESIDVGAGWLELATLLDRWKGALEKTVKKQNARFATQGDESIDADSSGGRAALTLRYEEVALAFDDDAPADGPTFEAHALPSDPMVLAALPLAQEEPISSVSPPPPPPARVDSTPPAPPVAAASATSPSTATITVRPPRRARRTSPAMAALAFVAVVLFAALLAGFAR
ncbi:MAG TPA: serine/threonine-protein kinase [Polyangiaceae bacterium]|jgi:serine/threonine protein kinase